MRIPRTEKLLVDVLAEIPQEILANLPIHQNDLYGHNVRYVHLKEADFPSPLGFIQNSPDVYWRCKIESIDAFNFGALWRDAIKIEKDSLKNKVE